MFRPRPDAPAATVEVEVDGRTVRVPEGASAAAAKLGLDTLLIDEQEGPGGQIYRAIERADTTGLSPLGTDYLAGQPLVAALRTSGARYRPATMVWHIDADGMLSLASNGASD